MKTLLLSGIAALFLATGAAHARNIPPPITANVLAIVILSSLDAFTIT